MSINCAINVCIPFKILAQLAICNDWSYGRIQCVDAVLTCCIPSESIIRTSTYIHTLALHQTAFARIPCLAMLGNSKGYTALCFSASVHSMADVDDHER